VTVNQFEAAYLHPSGATYLSTRTRGRVAGALNLVRRLVADGNSMATAQAVVAGRPDHVESLADASREVGRESARTDFLAMT
jgi:malonyl CoA-acyl carrier protein transacylase